MTSQYLCSRISANLVMPQLSNWHFSQHLSPKEVIRRGPISKLHSKNNRFNNDVSCTITFMLFLRCYWFKSIWHMNLLYLLFCISVKLGLSHNGRSRNWGCPRTGWWREWGAS